MQWWAVQQFIKRKLSLNTVLMELMDDKDQKGRGSERAPLASEEGMEESPIQLSGTEVEVTRGNEFKVR
jgi:hypothetical protein